jgi:hypothetical protein
LESNNIGFNYVLQRNIIVTEDNNYPADIISRRHAWLKDLPEQNAEHQIPSGF